MIKSILFFCAFLTCGIVKGQTTVAATDLKYCEGKVITVCQKVTSTFMTKTPEKTTFLNFGNFPNQLFTVVIYEEDLKNFKYNPVEFLKDKEICVIGDVIMRDSGPEIIVESPDQIEIKN